jgi:NADH:ubiquinone oxidoreductase subunit E
MANKNIRTLSSRKGLENNLFEKIAELSEKNAGQEEFQTLSRQFMIDDSVIFGTASFYDFIKPENRKQKIRVCNGTACMVARSQDKVNAFVSKHFDADEIGHVACVGRCHSNGAVMYDQKTYTLDSEASLIQILKGDQNTQLYENNYAVECNTTPILTAKIDHIEQFFALADDYVNKKSGIIDEL